jgi:hypothetical protein
MNDTVSIVEGYPLRNSGLLSTGKRNLSIFVCTVGLTGKTLQGLRLGVEKKKREQFDFGHAHRRRDLLSSTVQSRFPVPASLPETHTVAVPFSLVSSRCLLIKIIFSLALLTFTPKLPCPFRYHVRS